VTTLFLDVGDELEIRIARNRRINRLGARWTDAQSLRRSRRSRCRPQKKKTIKKKKINRKKEKKKNHAVAV